MPFCLLLRKPSEASLETLYVPPSQTLTAFVRQVGDSRRARERQKLARRRTRWASGLLVVPCGTLPALLLAPRSRKTAPPRTKAHSSTTKIYPALTHTLFSTLHPLPQVLEYARRGDLGRRIQKLKDRNQTMKEEEIWSMVIQMCRGLGALHAKVRRDLW